MEISTVPYSAQFGEKSGPVGGGERLRGLRGLIHDQRHAIACYIQNKTSPITPCIRPGTSWKYHLCSASALVSMRLLAPIETRWV